MVLVLFSQASFFILHITSLIPYTKQGDDWMSMVKWSIAMPSANNDFRLECKRTEKYDWFVLL